jgi:hypothetical protein
MIKMLRALVYFWAADRPASTFPIHWKMTAKSTYFQWIAGNRNYSYLKASTGFSLDAL